ncbi:unnamed protein product [Thelazia callipaeda]|uniref:tRNA (uracil-O(2)-)-methyltransferase n=1 Tax=Thelazia callipaeda TaxID=103827 RepID=A0A0N5CXY1_THECL|nr:unnamed protein product [Thelazia callipaeda]
MDFEKVATAQVFVPLECDMGHAFFKIITLWKEQCHTVNRRLSGTILVPEYDRRRDEVLLIADISLQDIEVYKFLPKSPAIFSSCAYEISFWLDFFSVSTPKSLDSKTIEFRSVVLDGKQHPHVPIPYRFALEIMDKEWYMSLYIMKTRNCQWLRDIAFPRLIKWFSVVNKQCSVTSHNLISVEDYSRIYQDIKKKWGQQIAAEWTEKTSPQKFVYEDCAIAAYLIAYWQPFAPRKFCDVGCGNGLLVHLLRKMKCNGYGIDLRKRRVWTRFVDTDLREKTLNPEKDVINDADFLIGNHTDELTPWIPILAARSKSDFFLLPCCPFDFYHRFQKKRRTGAPSLYASYLLFIRNICLRLGYCVREDRLKIPSTKRYCFLCTVPVDGLVKNVDDVINELLTSSLSEFVPREKFEKVSCVRFVVKNCSQLPWNFRQMLISKIVNYLLESSPMKSTELWRKGQPHPIKQIAVILDEEERTNLRDSHGGIQTFLKNQHQIFQVVKGTVSIRNWLEEGRKKVPGKEKTSDCWFHKYYPYGCPLQAENCSYKH